MHSAPEGFLQPKYQYIRPSTSIRPNTFFVHSNKIHVPTILQALLNMDPFTAIGFASNILTFVDFTWKLFTETREIYESSSGLTENVRTIESVARDATELSNTITLSATYDDNLRELAQECRGGCRHPSRHYTKDKTTERGQKI